MKKYDARLIRDAITAIGLYFLDKCFNNNVKHCRNYLFVTVAQSSYVSTFKVTYVLTSLSAAAGYQRVYTSFSYQHQTEHTGAQPSKLATANSNCHGNCHSKTVLPGPI